MASTIIFLVAFPKDPNKVRLVEKNVIVEATDREYAKGYASIILGGDPDYYIVTPLTERGDRTIFLLGDTR